MLEPHMELTRDEKEIVFIRVPSHVDIRGNSADSAAKDARDDDISDELIRYSDWKSCVICVRAFAVYPEWDEFPENKLHKIFQS